MKQVRHTFGLWGLTASLGMAAAEVHAKEVPGYHKDLFVDCGRHLLCPTPHAAKHLGLSYEILRASSAAEQNKHIVGHAQDDNGVLLYPDGAPRYRAIYVNGGESKDHGRTLGAKGLASFRNFYLSGGSYTGSCAGAFIASSRRMGKDMKDLYFSIWPGETKETWYGAQASSWYIGPSAFTIEKDSPLLKYNDFGKDLYVDDIKHYEGPYALEGEHWPEKTQVLARFDLPKARFHETPAIWAYKQDEHTGNMVVVASHPENYRSGERMDLMAAILAYALDGTAKPKLKGLLRPGKPVQMNKASADQDPCLTKIGDGQLHHFALKVPKGTKEFSLELTGDKSLSSGEKAQLHLFAHPQSTAWPHDADHKSQNAGSEQSLVVSNPKPGIWFVAVLGASRVSPIAQTSATDYSKNLGALNGIGYQLSLTLDNQTLTGALENDPDPWCNRFIHEIDALPDPDNDPDASPSLTPDESSSATEKSDENTSSPKGGTSPQEPEDSQAPSSSPDKQDSQDPQQDDEKSNQSPPPGGCQLHSSHPSWAIFLLAFGYVKSRRRKSSLAIKRHTSP